MAQETALVTGASSGIGAALARLFAADGSNLVLTARREDRLQALAQELRTQHGVETHVIVQDLAEPNGAARIVDHLAQAGVDVDVLVNNAGFGLYGPHLELPLDRQMQMIQVNIAALTYLTRALLPRIVARNRGGVLNVGSVAGFQPGPLMAVYFATKAYVLHFTEALAEELAPTKVHVTCLAPGPTATEFGEVSGLSASRLFQGRIASAERVARAGYRAFRRGKVLVVPGWMQRLQVFTERFAPRWLVRKVTHFMTQRPWMYR